MKKFLQIFMFVVFGAFLMNLTTLPAFAGMPKKVAIRAKCRECQSVANQLSEAAHQASVRRYLISQWQKRLNSMSSRYGSLSSINRQLKTAKGAKKKDLTFTKNSITNAKNRIGKLQGELSKYNMQRRKYRTRLSHCESTKCKKGGKKDLSYFLKSPTPKTVPAHCKSCDKVDKQIEKLNIRKKQAERSLSDSQNRLSEMEAKHGTAQDLDNEHKALRKRISERSNSLHSRGINPYKDKSFNDLIEQSANVTYRKSKLSQQQGIVDSYKDYLNDINSKLKKLMQNKKDCAKGKCPTPVKTSALPSVGPSDRGDFAGAFAGVGTGFNISNTTFKRDVNGNHESENLDATGIKGLLMAGYGWNFMAHGYIAVMVMASIHHLGMMNESVFGSDVQRAGIESQYGLVLMPGLYLNPHALLFFQLGVMRGIYDLVDDYIPASHNLGISNSNDDHTLTGFLYGVGLQLMVCHHLALMFAFNHTIYQNYDQFESNNQGDFWVHHCPEDSQFEAALVFHFGGMSPAE